MPWGMEWLHTLGFLPGEFHGHRSLVGYSPWGPKESDTTEQPFTFTHSGEATRRVFCTCQMLTKGNLSFRLRKHTCSPFILKGQTTDFRCEINWAPAETPGGLRSPPDWCFKHRRAWRSYRWGPGETTCAHSQTFRRQHFLKAYLAHGRKGRVAGSIQVLNQQLNAAGDDTASQIHHCGHGLQKRLVNDPPTQPPARVLGTCAKPSFTISSEKLEFLYFKNEWMTKRSILAPPSF